MMAYFGVGPTDIHSAYTYSSIPMTLLVNEVVTLTVIWKVLPCKTTFFPTLKSSIV